MPITPALLPDLVAAIDDTIQQHAEEVAALDQAIGDGDHVVNLQRGIRVLKAQSPEWVGLEWADVWQKMGMALMSSVGGASGSLYATLFITMSKHTARAHAATQSTFTESLNQGVVAVKQRGKADVGEKTLLDVLVPVASRLQELTESGAPLSEVLTALEQVAVTGMESTRDMLATKGRASFLGERSRGHIDAGAKTLQLMVCATTAVLAQVSAAPA